MYLSLDKRVGVVHTEDLLAVCNFFVARNNGRRGGRGKNDSELRAKRVKLNPSPAWKKRLRKWMGTARWTYNQCVQLVKDKKV